MEIESSFYSLSVIFIVLTTFISVAYVVRSMGELKRCAPNVKYYRIYFFIVLVAYIGQAILILLEIELLLMHLLIAYVIGSTALLVAFDTRLQTAFVRYLSISLLVVFSISMLFAKIGDATLLMTHAYFSIAFYGYLSYLALKNRALTKNLGYSIMAFAFMIFVIAGFVELVYLFKNDLLLAYSIASASTVNGFMLIVVGFLSINLIDEQKYFNSLALTDALTGMNNRRGLDYLLQTIIPTYNRNEKCFSVVTIDIDFFKKVNDTYGHDTGDVVLKKFANLIKNNHRNNDISCRFGGEEFLIVLPDTNKEDAIILSEKIREVIENTEIEIQGKSLSVTASFGVATSCKIINMDELYKDSDKALYIAKYSGRNKVAHIDDN